MDFVRHRLPKMLALFALIAITPLPVLVNRFQVATLDPDIWWQTRVGQWILANHAVPHVGIFSQHAMDHPWVAYSWGFEVFAAWLLKIFGLAFIPIWLGFMRALIAFVIFVVLWRVARRFWVAWWLAAATVLAIHLVMVIRPVLFSILFFVIEIGLIFEARARRSVRPLYWTPLLFWLWANIHIQFVYGLFVLGLFIVWTWVPRSNEEQRGGLPSGQVSLIGLICLVATVAGPYGSKLYSVIFHYAGNTAQYDQIQELAAPNFRHWPDFALLLLLLVAAFTLGRKQWDLFSGALLVTSACVAFRSSRDVWFLAIPAAAMIAECFRCEEAKELSRAAWLSFVATFVIAFGVVVFYMRSVGLDAGTIIASVDRSYPVRATGFVMEHQLRGPMYNSFDWGGFLIFNLRDYPVSVDGRNDFYGPENFAQKQNTLNGIDWQKDPDLARAGFVLIPRGAPLEQVLQMDTDYSRVYADHLAVIFVKK